jgi:hypothetical protein
MAGEGSSSGAKRPAYHDLDSSDWDDIVATPMEIPTASNTQSAPSSTSEGKKKQKASAHEKNPEYPPKQYGHFVREKVLEWYNKKTAGMLERTYIQHNADGLMSLQVELNGVITEALQTSEFYNNYDKDYWEYGRWLDQQIISSTSNIVHGFECVYKKGEDGEYNQRDLALLQKLQGIQKFAARFSNNKSKTVPWRLQALKSAMEQYMGGGLVYLPETAEVIAVPGFGNEGGYGEIRKVRISRVVNIPTVIDFAGKKSKATSEVAKRKERAVEALACPIEHAGLIKFWAVDSKTMEAYTLWWNGGSFRSFMRINSKVSLAEDYENILNHPAHTMQELEMIKAYRTKAAKLAMSLIITMARVHKSKILHNDISPSNILLHFPPDHVDRVYIGVCDWGMATRFIEDEQSVYGYPTKAEMEKNKKERYWVAPELFYVYGPPKSETAIEHVRWKHLYTPESDAYSVGKLALRIWNDEWDRDLFKTAECGSIFLSKLTALTNEDPTERPSLAHVIDIFKSKPYQMVMPDCCFRYEI